MKKISLLMLCISMVATMANATNYFVDGTVSSSGDGLSWATAKKTIAEAATLATANTGVDNVFVKGGLYAMGSTQLIFPTGDDYFGSCKGDETSAAGRPHFDNDGNGTVEPWEFQYPTQLTSTHVDNNSSSTLVKKGPFILNFKPDGSTTAGVQGPLTVDGFKFTHTGSHATYVDCTINIVNSSVFNNNIIAGCTLDYSMAGSVWCILAATNGTFSNSLIENNNLTLTSTATNSVGTCTPTLSISSGSKVFNCVVRNNKLNLNCAIVYVSTATPPVTSSNTNIRGLMVHMSGSASATTVVKNLLVHNNEVNYTGNAAYPSLTIGSTFCVSNTYVGDSILNCTVANNKGTNIFNAGIHFYSQTASTYGMQAYNNVAWNNQNNSTLSNMAASATSYYVTNSVISNNFTNGAGLTNGTPKIANSDNSQTAPDNSAFKFRRPTTTIGNTVDGSSELSNWTLTSGSYLAAKGLTASNNSDLLGNTFATPRAVGAYELQNFTTTVSFNANGTVNSYTNGQVVSFGAGAQTAYTITPASGYQITSVLYNGVDVTSSLVGNVYTAAAQYANATLAVTFDVATGMENLSNGLKVFTLANSLELRGLTVGDKIIISDIRGIQIKSQIATDANSSISLAAGVYLVRVNNLVKKVVVQ